MINKETMEIVSSEHIAKDTIEMVLKNKYISTNAVPGQFLHIAVLGHTLRRPISIAAVDEAKELVTILFKIIGSGTDVLANYPIGSTVDVLGPSGNGFPLNKVTSSDRVLLIGGGIGVPPLYYLATALHSLGVHMQIVIGFQSKEFVFYEAAFEALGETTVVTNDGSYGEKGYVTNVVDTLDPFDRYYTCGPRAMLQAVKRVFPDKEGYISFEERMGCGIGACLACVIDSTDGSSYKKICQDGPVFAANEVSI